MHIEASNRRKKNHTLTFHQISDQTAWTLILMYDPLKPATQEKFQIVISLKHFICYPDHYEMII